MCERMLSESMYESVGVKVCKWTSERWCVRMCYYLNPTIIRTEFNRITEQITKHDAEFDRVNEHNHGTIVSFGAHQFEIDIFGEGREHVRFHRVSHEGQQQLVGRLDGIHSCGKGC